MGFMVNLPPQAKLTMEFMETVKTEMGLRFFRLTEHFMVTSILSQGCFQVVVDLGLIPRAVLKFKYFGADGPTWLNRTLLEDSRTG